MYCDYFIWCVSCTVVILTCFVIRGCAYVWVFRGCFDNCVGVLVTRVLVFIVILYCFVYVYSYLLLVYGLLPPSENPTAVYNDNNKNNNNVSNSEYIPGQSRLNLHTPKHGGW